MSRRPVRTALARRPPTRDKSRAPPGDQLRKEHFRPEHFDAQLRAESELGASSGTYLLRLLCLIKINLESYCADEERPNFRLLLYGYTCELWVDLYLFLNARTQNVIIRTGFRSKDTA